MATPLPSAPLSSLRSAFEISKGLLIYLFTHIWIYTIFTEDSRCSLIFQKCSLWLAHLHLSPLFLTDSELQLSWSKYKNREGSPTTGWQMRSENDPESLGTAAISENWQNNPVFVSFIQKKGSKLMCPQETGCHRK